MVPTVPLMSLWLPILVSAVLVFIASSVIHMMIGYHRADYRRVPAEDDTAEALRKAAIPPGDYMLPSPGSRNAMKDPVFREKLTRGPVVFMTVLRPGPPTMGPQLIQWFAYCVMVSILAAYLTGSAVGPGGESVRVFCFACTAAFLAYALAHWQNMIWYKRSLGTTIRNTIDGLIYGLLTGTAFAWLWPR